MCRETKKSIYSYCTFCQFYKFCCIMRIFKSTSETSKKNKLIYICSYLFLSNLTGSQLGNLSRLAAGQVNLTALSIKVRGGGALAQLPPIRRVSSRARALYSSIYVNYCKTPVVFDLQYLVCTPRIQLCSTNG